MSLQPTRRSTAILIALALCMAVQMTGFVMISPLFARRFESFGAGVQALGMSDLAYALAAALFAPLMGILADRTGPRPVILLSLAAYVVAFSGYLFAASTWLFILLRGLAGVFTAGLVPAMTSIVGDLALENRRAQWIGIVIGGASFGWVVGPIFGGLLYDRFGYVVPFAIAIGMELGALLLAVFLVPETHRLAFPPLAPQPASRGRVRPTVLPAFYLLMLISFGIMFTWAFIQPQLMFYAYDDLAWTSARLGLVIGMYGLACMVGEFGLGRLSDRLGRRPVLVAGLVLFSAQFIGLLIFRDVTWLIVSFILAGLGNSLLDPALSAHLLDISPPEHTAGMMGLRSTAGSLGSLLGPGLIVLLAPFAGPQVIFLIASVTITVLTLASAFGLRMPARNEPGSDFSKAAALR